MSIYIIIRPENDQDKKVVAINSTVKTIGRSSSCDIQIKDERLSREHCTVCLRNNKTIIKDLDTKNGMTLNNVSIKEQQIYIGDVIYLCKSILFLDISKMTKDEKQNHTRLF